MSWLDRVIARWKAHRSLIIIVESHSDNSGSVQQQEERAMRRTVRVRDYLIEGEVKTDRIQTRCFGARRPVADNRLASGRARNNRVDVKIITGK
jgi:OmpA-OmpF porin, OOP family